MIKMQTLSHPTTQLHQMDQKPTQNLDITTYKHKYGNLHHTKVQKLQEMRWTSKKASHNITIFILFFNLPINLQRSTKLARNEERTTSRLGFKVKGTSRRGILVSSPKSQIGAFKYEANPKIVGLGCNRHQAPWPSKAYISYKA